MKKAGFRLLSLLPVDPWKVKPAFNNRLEKNDDYRSFNNDIDSGLCKADG